MIRVVLDANILASGAVAAPGGTLAQIIDAMEANAFELVLSAHILAELARALAKPYFARRIAAEDARSYLASVERRATVIEPNVLVQGVATHAEDDIVLATAVSAADCLVTGDHGLQRVGTYQGVTIMSPSQFLQWLQARDAPA